MNSAIFASFVDPCQVGRSHELYSAVPPHASVGSLHLAMARYTCKGIFPIILVRRLMLFDWTTRFPTKIDNKAACECGRTVRKSGFVKGCGCRPVTMIAARSWAGVRKPPRREPAGR